MFSGTKVLKLNIIKNSVREFMNIGPVKISKRFTSEKTNIRDSIIFSNKCV